MSSLPPDIESSASTIADAFRFLFVMPVTAAVAMLRQPDKAYDAARKRVDVLIGALCEAKLFSVKEYIACTQQYLDLDAPDRTYTIKTPLSMTTYIKFATTVLWKPFNDVMPTFAPQSFLLPTTITQTLIPSREGLGFSPHEIHTVMLEAEDENSLMVEKIRQQMQSGKRKSASYDLRNSEQHVLFQAYNHLMFNVQAARFVGHERTSRWESNHLSPPALDPHAQYEAKGKRIAVLYVGNLSPKALWLFSHILLENERYNALEMIW